MVHILSNKIAMKELNKRELIEICGGGIVSDFIDRCIGVYEGVKRMF